MNEYIEIGKRVQESRKNKNFSRNELAEILDLSPYFIGQIERGETKMSVDTLIKLSERLNISLDYLIKGQIVSYRQDLNAILKNCSDSEIELIINILKYAIPQLKNFKKNN